MGEGRGVIGYRAGPSGVEIQVEMDEKTAQLVVMGREPSTWNRIPTRPVLWRQEGDGGFFFVFPSREAMNRFLDWTGYGTFVRRVDPDIEGIDCKAVEAQVPRL